MNRKRIFGIIAMLAILVSVTAWKQQIYENGQQNVAYKGYSSNISEIGEHEVWACDPIQIDLITKWL